MSSVVDVRRGSVRSGVTQPPAQDLASDDNGLAGARRIYLQRSPNGYGFLFSSNGGAGAAGIAGTQGMNHFVSRIDDGSPASVSGLQLGDRILKVNDVSILNAVHKSVVDMIQRSPAGAPLRLVVCTPQRITPGTLAVHGHMDTTSSHFSDDASSRSQV